MKAIGKYEILEKIGVGGFGEVFKAYDPFIKRYVAIKTCTSEGADIRKRFFKEAEIAGNLHHRNITTIYDFGIQGDLPYLIQEYLSGEDLDRKIQRRDYLPYQEKLFYLIQIARGLAHAHSSGIIHRDIKPGNIRILEDGTAKILDFGIAKLAQEETGLTEAGMTIGTAAYLAPEQVRGDPVDLRTDIFSFGVSAYELLSLERPFRGDQISAVLYKILHDEPQPLSTSEAQAPALLLSIVATCLNKEPDRRFADASQLSRALEEVQHASPPLPVPTPAGNEAVPGGKQQHQPLSQIELGTRGESLSETRTVIERISNRRSSRTFKMLLPLLLALLAIAGGWWFGARPARVKTAERVADAAKLESIEVAPTHLPPSPQARTSELPGTATASAESNGPVLDEAPSVDSSPPAPVLEPEAQTTPEVTTGMVLLEPLPWTRRMQVSIAGRTYGLDRAHQIQLEAGSYTATFSLDENGYTVRSTRDFRIEIGSESALVPNIPRPALVTFRSLPGRPQADIYIDDELVGGSPLSRLVRAPGFHTVSIRLASESGTAPTVVEQINFTSNRETVVTFDVEASRIEVGDKPLSEGD